jgi:voltage-gated sodium channel
MHTIPGGHNGGRKFQFKVEGTEEQYNKWVDTLQACMKTAKERALNQTRQHPVQRLQTYTRKIHDSDAFQQFFGIVIMSSFLVSLVRTEMVPTPGTPVDDVFETLDDVFTGLFTVELLVTFVAHAIFLFFQDGWRIFDTIIVVISLLSASGAELPAVNSIRAIRVLRAVRLLKKSKSLRPIVEALFASILPVCNSMILLGLITAIYASMAVGLFGEDHPILFGKLSRSMYTMFQVCTGDAWSTSVARLMFTDDIVEPLPVLFFVSASARV